MTLRSAFRPRPAAYWGGRLCAPDDLVRNRFVGRKACRVERVHP